MIAPSNSSTSTSRTTRIERSASWKTIWPTSDFSARSCDDLVEAVQVGDLADEVLLLGALGSGADDHAALADVDLVDQLAEAGPLAVGEALGDADPAALRHVDEVAARDRELHREARALGLQRVLDDLDDDLLAGLDQLVDPAAPAAAALRDGLAVRQDDLVDVQEAVSLQADVDERRLHPGQDVVDLALVDVADDRAAAAALNVELGDLPFVGGGGLLAARLPCLGLPFASSTATRVSPRSTLTRMFFFMIFLSCASQSTQARATRRGRLRVRGCRCGCALGGSAQQWDRRPAAGARAALVRGCSAGARSPGR